MDNSLGYLVAAHETDATRAGDAGSGGGFPVVRVHALHHSGADPKQPCAPARTIAPRASMGILATGRKARRAVRRRNRTHGSLGVSAEAAARISPAIPRRRPRGSRGSSGAHG